MIGPRWLLDSQVKSMRDISLRVLLVPLHYCASRTMGESAYQPLLERQATFISSVVPATFAFTCTELRL